MPVKKRQIICRICGLSRREIARGLCDKCYRVENHVMVICKTCNESKRHYGNGLCLACHSKKRREENPDYFKAYDKKKWETRDKEAQKARNRKQYLKNPDIYSHYAHRRMARNKGLVYDLTYDQWLDILKMNGYACYYCGAKNVDLQREHKTPRSKGGGYTFSNIVPACQSCNLLKGEKTEKEFIESRLASL